MSCINADTAGAWRDMAQTLGMTRPRAGRTVYVAGGRKHRGRYGTVSRHEISRFGNAYRYGGEANHHMRDLVGREGWVCLVRPLDLSAPFWVNAAHLTCIQDFHCAECGCTFGGCDCPSAIAHDPDGERELIVADVCEVGCG